MADTNTVVHIGENSPEQVAFKLMEVAARIEGLQLYSHGEKPASRKWMLDAYAECLEAVKGYRKAP